MLKFRKVASIMASAVMLSSTVALAAAANFPSPFVQSGMANVAVVWGQNAPSGIDVASASSIVKALNDALPSQAASTTTITSTNSSGVSGGDAKKLEKSSNKFNLGNEMDDIYSNLDSEDLEVLLADGTYSNDENTEYDYEQTLNLEPLQMTYFADSDFEDKTPTVGFKVASGDAIVNYTLDFTTDAESDVSSGDLPDFETTTLHILGKDYYVLDAKNGTTDPYFGKWTLLDAANTAIITDGETSTVVVGDKEYQIGINFIDSNEVMLEVGGQKTNSLNEGETYKLADGTYIGVKDILYNSKDTGVSKVEISIGSGKLEISSDGSEIEMNDDTVDGVRAWFVKGTSTSTKAKLDKIIIEWIADEEGFIAGNEALTLPGFGSVKLLMDGFVRPDSELTSVEYDGDDQIVLKAPIKSGDVTIPILFANSTGDFTVIGEDTDKRLATTSSNSLVYIQKAGGEDYHQNMIVTYNASDDEASYLVEVKITESDNVNKVTIKDAENGKIYCSDQENGDDCDIGDASLTIGTVNKDGTEDNVTLTGGSSVSFDTLYTEDGLKINLPYTAATGAGTAPGAFNLTSSVAGHNPSSFVVFFTEENKEGDRGAGNSFNVTVGGNSDGDVEVTDIDSGQSELDVPGSSDDLVTMVQSDLATQITYKVTSDKGKAEINYAGDEAYGNVYVTSSSATAGSGGSSGGEKGVVMISDTEVDSASGKNLIVVGGSCINTVASSLLGGTAPMCGSDFTAKTGVEANQYLIQTFDRGNGKVATLVAGYNAVDTQNAATYLTTQTVDTTIGKKYVGTTATQASAVTA